MMKIVALLGVSTFLALAFAQFSTKDVTGNWEGESKCVNLKVAPACKDEHVIFHITGIPKKPGSVRVQASKVVDKQEEEMGDLVFTIDPKTSSITNEFVNKGSHGLWKLTIKGDSMTGTLSKDKVVVRRLTLKAQKKG